MIFFSFTFSLFFSSSVCVTSLLPYSPLQCEKVDGRIWNSQLEKHSQRSPSAINILSSELCCQLEIGEVSYCNFFMYLADINLCHLLENYAFFCGK